MNKTKMRVDVKDIILVGSLNLVIPIGKYKIHHNSTFRTYIRRKATIGALEKCTQA